MTDKKARVGPKDLGLDLKSGDDAQLFKWLVACQLFGARINQEIAARTFSELDKAGVLTPRKLAHADWQRLVDLLGAGGYRRYDESTANELIAVGEHLVTDYGGSMTKLRDSAETKKDVERRLQEFKGIGPKAAEIFLREVAPVWDV